MIVKMIMIITIMMITTITVKNKVNKVENGTELTFTFKYLSLLMSKLSRTKSSYSEEKEECIKCSENTGCPYSCHEGEKMLVRLGGGGRLPLSASFAEHRTSMSPFRTLKT